MPSSVVVGCQTGGGSHGFRGMGSGLLFPTPRPRPCGQLILLMESRIMSYDAFVSPAVCTPPFPVHLIIYGEHASCSILQCSPTQFGFGSLYPPPAKTECTQIVPILLCPTLHCT